MPALHRDGISVSAGKVITVRLFGAPTGSGPALQTMTSVSAGRSKAAPSNAGRFDAPSFTAMTMLSVGVFAINGPEGAEARASG